MSHKDGSTIKIYCCFSGASNGGNSTSQSEPHRQSRSLSPAAAQLSRWCSPVRSSAAPPSSGTGVHGSASTRAGASTGPSSAAAALFEKERVPPLLLAPTEWGIGLGGEWVSASGPHPIRGASSENANGNRPAPPLAYMASKGSRLTASSKCHVAGLLCWRGKESVRCRVLPLHISRGESLLPRPRQAIQNCVLSTVVWISCSPALPLKARWPLNRLFFLKVDRRCPGFSSTPFPTLLAFPLPSFAANKRPWLTGSR